VTTDTLLAAADRCVKCGLCLPHCPTYALYRSEAESPRGRIALIQALVEGRLEATDDLRGHLDRCLLCRNCERACPSLVEYGLLMDGARARLAQGRSPGLLLSTLTRPRALQGLANLNALLRPLGLERVLPERQARMAGWLGSSSRPPLVARAGALPPTGRRVAIFSGCVSRVTDAGVIAAARRLLEYLGWTVELPEEQACCGAMHLHEGFAEDAQALIQRNRRVFSDPQVEAVLTVASGCGAHLAEHGQLGPPVRDVGAFLADADWPAELLEAMPALTVALHQPCSLRNVMREAAGVTRLLARFEGLSVVSMGTGGCCGGAGMQLVDEPEMAASLGAAQLASLETASADVLLTSSTGCALSLAAAVERAGLSLPVRHPVEFIAQQLGI